jgi:hypothetical protein
MKIELKPCPFCGSSDICLANTHTAAFWVECQTCDAEARGDAFGYRGKKENALFAYDPEAKPGTPFTATEIRQMPAAYQKAAASAIKAWNTRAPQGADR